MFPILNLGPAVIPTAPLILIIGMYGGLSVVEASAKRLGLDAVKTYGVAANSLIVGFVVARIAFVLNHLSTFLERPIAIVWPLTSGYSLATGVLGGLLMLVFLRSRHNLPLRPTLLAVLPAVLTMLLAISLSDLVARPGVGTLTTLPWGIERVGLRRHPVELYEMAVVLLGLAIWWRLVRTTPAKAFWLTVGVVSFGRFITDAFRITTPVLSSGHHIAQLVLLPIVLLCVYQLSVNGRQ